jgi:O-antigen/teichoic acid export membrane protein
MGNVSLKSAGFRKYFRNTLWMFLTYGLRLFTGFFVGLWLARYLGPENYGIYNYVISFTTIIITVAQFGTTEILIKKILDAPERIGRILKAGFDLRILLSLILFGAFMTYVTLSEEGETRRYLYVSIFAIFFQPFEVVDAFFRARVLAEKSSIGRMAQLILSSVLKILLIVYHAPLSWFYFVFVFDGLFYALMVLMAYWKENENFLVSKADRETIKEVALDSFPLMVIAVTSLMLARFDQVLIGKLLTKTDVGFYSAASKTVEIGSLFSVLVSLSLYPAILNARKTSQEIYQRRMAMLNRLLVGGGLVLTILVSFFANFVIKILFGDQYGPSQEILRLLSLNILFISFYQVSYRWYLSEGLQHQMMVKTLVAVAFNIALSVILIKQIGILGAAYASVATSFIFHFLYEAFSAKTRSCFKINTSFLRFR